MLLEISIKNFAIIEEIALSFDHGMTVLTGETGAGKSIIIDAMTMMLGGRASTDVIRRGTKKAEIEGLFSVANQPELSSLLEENGIAYSEELIIRRDIFDNGRSVCRINGQLVNVTTLKQIGQHLVDIHGQHDQEELMRPQHHIQMLDRFGGDDFQAVKLAYQEAFDQYRKLRKQVLHQRKHEEENRARIELLAFQLAEIEAAELSLGEETQLVAQREKLMNAKKIADTLSAVSLLLDDDEFSSLSNVRSAMMDMMTVEQFDPDYKDLSEQLGETYYALEDIAKRVSGLLDSLDFDGQLLQRIDERLNSIYTITRKYGSTVDEVLAYFDKISTEYALLTGSDLGSGDLEGRLKELEKELLAQANRLSQARHDLAQTLERDIKQELTELYMEKADFQVRFSQAKFNREGNEMVEFYISTNPGEGFKPLVKVASGGELSRLMLAIKASFAKRDHRTSIVFDEVDTGVSGRVAQAIAQKIYHIGQHGQVLAISHLPQVIAIADYQFFISKESREQSTVSHVRLLTDDERVEEVAKMLAGNDVTEAARVQARELLKG